MTTSEGTKGEIMASVQSDDLAELFGAVQDRLNNNPNLDLVTIRDILEALGNVAKEPENVTYAEVDAGGVPALWCIPEGCDNDCVLLHCHAGGSVVFSMHSDRKAAGHLAKTAGIRALVVDFRRSPENKFPAQPDDVETAYHWLLSQGYRPEKIAAGGQLDRWQSCGKSGYQAAGQGDCSARRHPSARRLVRPRAQERNIQDQRQERQDAVRAAGGILPRMLARWHWRLVQRSTHKPDVRRSGRTAADQPLLRRA